jgi:hypothetical protein
MPYKKAPSGHTEFGGGPGLIDPMSRANRNLTAEEELLEMYASNPNDGKTPLQEVDLDYRPLPKPTEWDDPKTAKGTVEP